MRTNDCAAVTLDTILRLPLGNVNSDSSLLKCGRTVGNSTVNVVNKAGNGKLVALVGVYGLEDSVYILNECALTVDLVGSSVVNSVSPVSRDLNLFEVRSMPRSIAA